MFPKKLPPFGHGPRVFWAECPKASGTFRGPRSTVFRAAPPYSHLRERHCLYFSQKLPPFLLREAAEDKSGLSSTALARRMILFGAPLSEEIVPDTACRARLKRPCPTLRVVLVSGVPCGSAVLAPSRKALFIVLQKAAPLRPRTSDRRGIAHISTISICHHLPVSL